MMADASTSSGETAQTKGRGLVKYREGIVVSDKMQKSVVVKVTTHKMHPKYKKFVLSSEKYVAHDEENECGIGDEVRIIECRPLSKSKRWRVQNIMKKAI